MLYPSTGALVHGANASPPKTRVVRTRGSMKKVMLINSLILVPTTAEPNLFLSLSKLVEAANKGRERLPVKQRRVYHGFCECQEGIEKNFKKFYLTPHIRSSIIVSSFTPNDCVSNLHNAKFFFGPVLYRGMYASIIPALSAPRDKP